MMNLSMSPSNFVGAGPSGLLSVQFLVRQKYQVSLGVLSVSHDKRKKGEPLSTLSDIFVASLSKNLTSQIWVRDFLSRILHHDLLQALVVAEQPNNKELFPLRKAKRHQRRGRTPWLGLSS